ncbi:hypothetical protein Tco_0624505 [Tanacetum coccineum]|uniref:Uncharacterized protein n=1 Tax=Tanacetum coccineum TaxID=301880 RepID=A0ABQ4WE80_9ASTR
MRIKPIKTPKEPTYQVVLDSLALSPLYPTFLITAETCQRLPNQEFDAPTSDEEIVTFIKELRHKGLDKIRLSRAQILWGMYYNKNVDFVELLWEDFVFQIDNREVKKQEKMYYPRFTKAIIHHFISKDTSIFMRNIIFMHTVRDDRDATPKKARKFKKPASPSKKKALVAVEEPTEKCNTPKLGRNGIWVGGGTS